LDSGRISHYNHPFGQPVNTGNSLYPTDPRFVLTNQSSATHPFGTISLEAHPLPIAKALASLDILDNLCEQSDWRWIEGMLVGGCLLYGLERYDGALKWFSTVTKMDST
jgi:hypothetical protein